MKVSNRGNALPLRPSLCDHYFLDNAPKATSTPRGADPVTDTGASQNGHQDGKEPDEDEAKRFSTSSELTQVTVSTTDLSSHGDELEIIDQKALSKNLQKYAVDRSQTTSIALSDVVVEMEHEGDTGEFPPPIPNSSPPSLEMEGIVDRHSLPPSLPLPSPSVSSKLLYHFPTHRYLTQEA